ncbi:MAG: Ig-like domain-containing protein, partial [Armatimonadetes bacterium]|nr:Ig-like domain-containing protein [Armatimonadota bacterium]
MAGELVLQPGEHRQLRAHGEAQRWESDNPRVATVTDEDLVAGTHGGLVTAVRAGQARITAVDFDGRNAIELAVTVAGAAPLALAAGARAVLPGDPAAGWTTEQTQVVRLEPGGQVVGLGPGVARVRDAAGSAEHEVRVSGALELGVGQRLALAERFGLAVNSWRAGSPAAEIDSHGVLTAGDRARALDVSATLASGEVFTFEVRIRAAAAAPEPVATTEVRVPPVTLPPDPPRSEPRAAAAEEVARHLAQARACAEQGQWEPSGGHLTAATVAAAGNPELEARVQATRAELRQASAGPGVTELLDALLAHDFAGARERARAARVPPGQREGLAAAADLIAPVERLTQGSLSPGD